MKIGLATVFFKDLPLIYGVRQTARYTNYIHISPIYEKVRREELIKLKELKDNLELNYYIHGYFPNYKQAPKRNGYNLKIIKETLDNAYFLESDIVIIHPSKRELYQESIKILKKALDYSKNLGIKLVLENKPEDYVFLKTIDDFKKISSDLPDIGFCFDTSHFYLWNQNLSEMNKVLREFKEKIEIFHIADCTKGVDLQSIPGYGTIDWFVFARTLVETELYKKPLILEALYPYEIERGILNLRNLILDSL